MTIAIWGILIHDFHANMWGFLIKVWCSGQSSISPFWALCALSSSYLWWPLLSFSPDNTKFSMVSMVGPAAFISCRGPVWRTRLTVRETEINGMKTSWFVGWMVLYIHWMGNWTVLWSENMRQLPGHMFLGRGCPDCSKYTELWHLRR